jgi:hypothetical protein
MEAEGRRGLADRIARITGEGYRDAFNRAQEQFNKEQAARNRFGFDVLGGLGTAGAKQRAIEQQGLSADIAAFEEERDFPYKQVQYMQSLLQGLPVEAQSVTYSQPSTLSKLLGGASDIRDLFSNLYGGSSGSGIVNAIAGEYLGPKTDIYGVPITDAQRASQDAAIDALNAGETITIGS